VSTQQTDPVFTPIPIDRRRHRLDLPPCQSCSSTNIAVATRTPYVVYVRCKACGFVWSVPKPGAEPL
jgi:hypothetical protein